MADERPKRRPTGRRRLDSGSAYQAMDDSGGLLSREALTHTEEIPLPVETVEEAPVAADKEDRLVRVMLGLAIAIAIWTVAFLYSQPSAAPAPRPVSKAPPVQQAAPAPAPSQAQTPSGNALDEIDGVRVKASISSGLYEEGQPQATGTAPAMDTPPTM